MVRSLGDMKDVNELPDRPAQSELPPASQTSFSAQLPPPTPIKFWRALAVCVPLFAVLGGVAITLNAAPALVKFGPQKLVPQYAALSIVRVTAAGIAVSAVVVALVAWAHGTQVVELRRRLRGMLGPALAGCVGALPVAGLLALFSSFAVMTIAYGMSWDAFQSAATEILRPADLIAAFGTLALNTLILGGLAWGALPLLARSLWPLWVKLVIAWIGMIAFKVVLSLFL